MGHKRGQRQISRQPRRESSSRTGGGRPAKDVAQRRGPSLMADRGSHQPLPLEVSALSASTPTAVGARPYRLPFVISASAAGTIIEWYDFYLYGVLAAFFSTQFFPPGNDTAALLASLATFGAGFAVRPFGAAFFGRIGDLIGRKFTFLLTILIMGLSTALVGLLPTYAQIGILAPIILVTLRLAQGLALGGEYGGAAIYVAEHSPDEKRGQNTSWIQTTATLGLLLALVVVGITRASMTAAEFTAWGWRIPFLFSVILVVDGPLHPAAAPGDAAVQPAQGRRQVLHVAVARQLRQLGQSTAHVPRAVRRDRRAGRRLVPGPVPGALLPRHGPRRPLHRCLSDRWHGDRPRDAFLRRIRPAVRPDRPEAGDPRRLPDRRDHLLPDLRADDPIRPSRRARSPRRGRPPASSSARMASRQRSPSRRSCR